MQHLHSKERNYFCFWAEYSKKDLKIDSKYGGLGDNSTTNRNSSVSLGTQNVTSIVFGKFHTLMLKNVSLFTFGRNNVNSFICIHF
jgi:hypothetical protein